jgi:hypothetical protein
VGARYARLTPGEVALLRSLLVLCAFLLPCVTRAASDAPLALRTQGTFRELFLDPTLSDARAVVRPSLEVRWSAANVWSTPTTFVRGDRTAEVATDEQADSLTFSARLPWSPLARRGAAGAWLAERASTTLEWRLTQHWGGWSDGTISTWHRVIRVFDFDRGRFSRDALRLRLGAPGAEGAVSVGSARLAAGDLVARTQVVLARGGLTADGDRERWAVALRGDVKAPTGSLDVGGGSGGWDGAAALVGTVEAASRLTLHGMAALAAWSALPEDAVLRVRRWHRSAELSLVARRGAWAFLLEDRVASPVFEGGWSYAGTAARRRASAYTAAFRPQNQVSLGVRRGRVTFWFSEDLTPGTGDPKDRWYYLSNAPDIAVGLSLALAP